MFDEIWFINFEKRTEGKNTINKSGIIDVSETENFAINHAKFNVADLISESNIRS